MVTSSPQVNRSSTPSDSLNYAPKADLMLQAVLESWIDGVLVLTEQGKWVQANAAARRLCDRLASDKTKSGLVPEAIWQVCSALIQSRNFYPQQPLVFESEIRIDAATVLRVRARWLHTESSMNPYLLVVLEDRYQSTHNLARVEAMRYNLTPRETNVWSLHRLGHSYKEIAKELFITIDTVKKHMKNIRAKQQLALCMEECGVN